MRAFLQFVLISCLAVSVLADAQPVPPDAAAAVVAAAREALGGEKKLAAVKTVLATGRTRQIRGDNLVPIEFEIAIELPDKYVRKDEIPAQESGPTQTGFSGETLLQFPAPSPPPARRRAPPRPEQFQRPAGAAEPDQSGLRAVMLGMFVEL